MGKNLQKGKGSGVGDSPTAEVLELTLNKETNQIILRDRDTGRVLVIDPKVVETTHEAKPQRRTLTVEEFGKVLDKLEALGITWSADIPPLPVLIDKKNRAVLSSEEYIQLQEEYPTFPRELGAIILHELTGGGALRVVAGDAEQLKQKAALLSGILTQGYRTEFFFRYAIKVPYFEDIDWEVVVKAYERGVKDMVKTPYALLTLTLRQPTDSSLNVEDGAGQYRRPELITVAVDETLLEQLLTRLGQVKVALHKAQQINLTEGDDNGAAS